MEIKKIISDRKLVSRYLKGEIDITELKNNGILLKMCIMTTIKQLKKELGISNADIAKFFNLTPKGYQNSSAKKRYEDGLCAFYDVVLERGQKKTKKSVSDKDGKP